MTSISLTPREQFVFTQRDAKVIYWVIAEALGVTPTRVWQIEAKARGKQAWFETVPQSPHWAMTKLQHYPALYNAVRRHYGRDSLHKLENDLHAGLIHPGSIRKLGHRYCALLYELYGVTEPEHSSNVQTVAATKERLRERRQARFTNQEEDYRW